MRFRELGLLAVIAAGALACGKGDGTTDSSRVASGRAGAAHNDSTLRIAIIAKSSTNPVFLAARTGAEAAAK